MNSCRPFSRLRPGPPGVRTERAGVRTHVALDGFMAAGKSSIGKRLAEILGRPFLDLDREIEIVHGPIAQIFTRGGEELFRRLEHETLLNVLDRPAAVIALGGGTAAFEPNMTALQSRSYRVFLDVPLNMLFRRLQRSHQERPMLGGRPQAEQIAQLYGRRLPAYQSADLHVLVSSEAPGTIAQRIFRALPSAVP